MSANQNALQSQNMQALFDQFGGSCRSTAKKLVIVVPECSGLPLVDQQGERIKDWEGKPVQGTGLVFTNQVASGNPTLQAVRTDGKEVVIFNNLNDEQEKAILEKLRFTGTDFYYNDGYPNPREKLKSTIEFAATIGAGDVYNSTIDFVNKKMTDRDGQPMQLQGGRLENGHHIVAAKTQRNGEDVSFIVLEKAGTFRGGPTAQAEEYVAGTVAIMDKDKSVRLVHPDVFQQTYQVIEPPKAASSTEAAPKSFRTTTPGNTETASSSSGASMSN